jgi:hypothetical protein
MSRRLFNEAVSSANYNLESDDISKQNKGICYEKKDECEKQN